MGVAGWPEVFRGSEAVAAGLVTKGALRGRRFVRIFPDVYALAGEEAPTLALRSRAAALLVAVRGVVSGYSAAELLGASCAPFGAPAEVTLLHGRQRAHPGLLVHRDQVTEGEEHTSRDGVLRDIGRYTRLVARGWRIYRYTKYEIRREPGRIVDDITRALG
jgi:hypothetical protein